MANVLQNGVAAPRLDLLPGANAAPVKIKVVRAFYYRDELCVIGRVLIVPASLATDLIGIHKAERCDD